MRIIVWFVSGMVAFGAGYSAPRRVGTSSEMYSSTDSSTQLTLQPVRIEGKSFELSVELEVLNFEPKSGAYSYAVWDDRNKVVHGPSDTILEPLAEGGFATPLITPSDLSAGFYRVHVAAAAAGDEGLVESVEENLYLEVTGNAAWIIPQEEWRIRSMHTFAMPVNEAAADNGADVLHSVRAAKPTNRVAFQAGTINPELADDRDNFDGNEPREAE